MQVAYHSSLKGAFESLKAEMEGLLTEASVRHSTAYARP
jgi:hypothetical protein